MKKQVIIVISILLMFILIFVGCANVYDDDIKNLEVTITGLYYKDAECGDGRTLYLNITWENTGDDEIRHVSPLLVNTDKNRERLLTFAGDRFEEIPPNTIINTTVMTWDTSVNCDSLKIDEYPVNFVFRYGVGEVIPPSSKKVKIPASLISD